MVGDVRDAKFARVSNIHDVTYNAGGYVFVPSSTAAPLASATVAIDMYTESNRH